MKTKSLIAALFICLLAGLASATTYYVNANTGNNTYDGLYRAHTGANHGPWQTITNAVTTAAAGDQILVAPGIYEVGIGETFPIVVPGMTVEADAYYTGAATIDAVADVIISLEANSRLTGDPATAYFYLQGTGANTQVWVSGDNVTVSGCDLNAANYRWGIFNYPYSNNIIERNTIRSAGQYGIYESTANAVSIRRNIIRNCSIAIRSENCNITIDRNTLAKNAEGMEVMTPTGITATVTYNIVTHQPALDLDAGGTGIGYYVSGTGVVVENHNDVWKNSFNYVPPGFNPDPTDISQCPRFVDSLNDDYRLYSDSPCVSAPNMGALDGSVAGSPYLIESYVSGSGSDANTGATAAQAWRSLSKASKYTINRINVGAGLYSAANGETFPLIFSLNRQLLGAGRDVSIIEGTAGSPVMQLSFGTSADSLGLKGSGGAATLEVIRTDNGPNYLSNCLIDATNYGYGINNADVLTLEGDVIHSASARGVKSTGNTNVYGCEIRGCGTGISLNKRSILDHDTLVNNSIGVIADTGFEVGSPVTVSNSIIDDHAAAGSLGLKQTNLHYLASRYNCFNVATPYTGSITDETGDIPLADPLFVDRAGNDYHLTASSPCIGKGSGGSDIGAYPFVPPTTTTTTTTTSTTTTTVPGGFTLLSKTARPLAGAPFDLSFSFDKSETMTLYIFAQQAAPLSPNTPVKTITVSVVKGRNTINWGPNYITDQGQAAPPGLYYYELRSGNTAYVKGVFLIAATK